MIQFDEKLTNNKRLQQLRASGEENLMKSLAPQYGLIYIDLRGVSINPSALKLVEEASAREAELIVFERKNKKLSVAIKNPHNPKTKEILAALEENGWETNLYMSSVASLKHAGRAIKMSKVLRLLRKGC